MDAWRGHCLEPQVLGPAETELEQLEFKPRMDPEHCPLPVLRLGYCPQESRVSSEPPGQEVRSWQIPGSR